MDNQFKEKDMTLKSSDIESEKTSSITNEYSSIKDILPPHLVLHSFIGKGGMGAVYKVKDKDSDKIYALKLLRPDLAEDQAAVKRFQQEARNIEKISHPDIVSTYSTGKTQDHNQYILMEYFDGTNLQRHIRENGALTEEESISLFIKLCKAMQYAHSQNIIHRDLKPGNVLVKKENDTLIPKIVDFGIAKLFGSNSHETMTNTGEVFGSPSYMSPEQCLGQELDEKSDVYSMGCLMYHCVTGAPPYESDTPILTAFQHIKSEIPEFELKTSISKNLKTVILGTLKKNPKYRYQSMQAVVDDLEKVAAGQKPSIKIRKKSSFKAIHFIASALVLTGLVAYSISIQPDQRAENYRINRVPKVTKNKNKYSIDMKTASIDEALALVAKAGKETGWDLEASSGNRHSHKAYEGSSISFKVSYALANRGSKIIPQLVARVNDRSDLVQNTCANALGRIGRESIAPLVKNLLNENKINKHVIEVLAKYPDDSITQLIDVASEAKGESQFFVMRVLGYLSATKGGAIPLDHKRRAELESIAFTATHDDCRFLASLLLTRQTEFESSTTTTLINRLEVDRSAKVRAAAASSLGAILYNAPPRLHSQTINALLEALNNDKSPSVRYSAAVNLAANAREREIDQNRLQKGLLDTDRQTQLAVKTAVAIKKSLSDPHSPVTMNTAKLLLNKAPKDNSIEDLVSLLHFFNQEAKKNSPKAFHLLTYYTNASKRPGFNIPLVLSYLNKIDYDLTSRKSLSTSIRSTISSAKQDAYPAYGWLLRFSSKKGNSTMIGRDFLRMTEVDKLLN